MSAMARTVMRKFYRQTNGNPEHLPGYRAGPGPLLERVVGARPRPGRTLGGHHRADVRARARPY